MYFRGFMVLGGFFRLKFADSLIVSAEKFEPGNCYLANSLVVSLLRKSEKRVFFRAGGLKFYFGQL